MEIEKTVGLKAHRSISHAAFWGYAGHLGNALLQLAGMIFLARMLTPGDFGTIGVLAVFFGLGSLIANSGLGSALLRQKEIAPEDWSTVFHYNLIAAIGCFGILLGSAPVIASFFQKAELTAIIRICALMLPLNALGTTRSLHLTRNLQQGTLTVISLVSAMLALAAALAAAWGALGVWALVIQQITASAVRVVLLFFCVPQLPGGGFCRQTFCRLLSFGYKVFFAGVANVIFDSLYSIVIGKFYSLGEVGFCDKAARLGSFPSAGVNGVLASILLPVLGRMQDDKSALKKQCRKLLVASSAFVVLFSVIGYTGGEAIIMLLLGEEWRPVIPLYRIFILSCLLMPLHIVNVQLMLAMNHPGYFLVADILKKTVCILFLVLTYRHGVYAIVSSWLGIAVFAGVINGHFGKLLIGYGFWAQCRDLLPIGIAGGLAGIAAHFGALLVPEAYAWAQIFPVAAITLAIYVPLTCGYYRISPIRFIRQQFPLIFPVSFRTKRAERV